MRIGKIQLINFKRFDDLTIDLGPDPKKIVALVGPNGSGKSSVFDSFEEEQQYIKGGGREDDSFFSKIYYTLIPGKKSQTYDRGRAVTVWKSDGSTEFDKKSFYIRTAYRFTPNLRVTSITAQPNVLDDPGRPFSSKQIDSRLQQNYAYLVGQVYDDFQGGNKTGTQALEEKVGKINSILSKILDIKITSLGNVITNKGQIFFEKGNESGFPYENLSSGEKEVVDIIIDLLVKIPEYNDTVFCIDEPELHLNTAIQRKLLTEIEKLIPDNCQLWVATHSIGFLRALQEDLKEKSQVLDFSERDYFNSTQTIKPIKTTRQNWQRIFSTALEDLTGLMSPEVIIYCEGRGKPSGNGEEKGLDARAYNNIFGEEFHNTLFVSAGGGSEIAAYAPIALSIISKAFSAVKLFVLKDRDILSDSERESFLKVGSANRMLERREIENYLYDKETLDGFLAAKGMSIDLATYSTFVSDIKSQDIKLGDTEARIKDYCGYQKNIPEFKVELSNHIKSGMKVYDELKKCIF